MYVRILLFVCLGLVTGESWFNELFWWMGKRQVCYDGYGCFSTEHPFSNSEGQLPQRPETLDVKIFLYNRQSRQEAIDVTNGVGREFNASKAIKILIHGYFHLESETWVRRMKDALLQKGDFNVFLLNWIRAAGTFNYHQAVANSRIVAVIMSKFLGNLQTNYNVDPTSIHIVGFSLGAHLAGYIGRSIPGLGRITGLDPAGPNFENTDPIVRLDPTDASFVDVIHTDSDQLFNLDLSPGFGTLQPLGHVDFYPNGGSDQPGCATHVNQHLLRILRGNFDPIRNWGCSHLRAVDLFTESINSNCRFTSFPCQLEMLETNACNSCEENECNYMGYNAKNRTGTFITITTKASPFCVL